MGTPVERRANAWLAQSGESEGLPKIRSPTKSNHKEKTTQNFILGGCRIEVRMVLIRSMLGHVPLVNVALDRSRVSGVLSGSDRDPVVTTRSNSVPTR